jgi:ethanolamine utilization protein EutQ (cupin superfamily)
MTPTGPLVVSVEDCTEVRVGPDGDEGTIKELITRRDGSKVLLGTFRLDVGQRGEFDLPHERGHEEEIYYLLAGRLRVSWDGGEATASAGEAILFPQGRRYTITSEGSSAVELLWTAYPAPEPLVDA